MVIIVEDGSLVVDANSYVDVAGVRAYAEARASTLPEDDTAVEAALIVAMDYLESLRDEYQGSKVSPGVQSLQWPRIGVVIDGWDFPTSAIPKELIFGQCQLAIESANGADLMPTGDGREVIKEKVDVLETVYSPGAGGAPQPVFAKVKAFLAPLLSSQTYGRMRVTRG